MVDCDIDHNFPTLEVCNVGLLAKREYCLYQPPLKISLKLVGMKKIRTGEIGWGLLFYKTFYFIILAMFLIMLFGITANASIIIIILRNKLLRLQPTNLFLLNMAVSDFLNLCMNPIFYLFGRDVLFTNYYLGKVSCLVTSFFTGK